MKNSELNSNLNLIKIKPFSQKLFTIFNLQKNKTYEMINKTLRIKINSNLSKSNYFLLYKVQNQKFTEFKINKRGIDKRKAQVNKNLQSIKSNIFFYKNLTKFIMITTVSFIIFWVLNGKELFRKLQLDKLYKKTVREREKKNNIDLELINNKINEFDEKYGINKPLNDYINKVQYGNKEFNEKEENEESESHDKEIIIKSIDKFTEKKNNVIDLYSPINASTEKLSINKENKEKIIIQENEISINREEKRNVRKIKADGFEQISVYEKNFDNPDPRVLGSTIVFDSRLDNKN